MSGLNELFSGLRIASSGLTAERKRVDIISENIANARTTSTVDGGPYRRKLVVFQNLHDGRGTEGVAAARVIEDTATPFERIHDVGHPDADAEGMVTYPNVNTVIEMADLITALRAYEANVTAQENYVRMAERALQLAR